MQKPAINAGCRDKSGTFGTWAEYTEMVSKARHAPFGILYLYKFPRIGHCFEDNLDSPPTLFLSP